MPLTAAEQTELDTLEAEAAGPLTPEEQTELAQLETEATGQVVTSDKLPSGGPLATVLEPAAAIATAAIAEPVAGIAGMVTSLIPGTAKGSGAGVVENVRKALTFEPRTQEGRAGLEAVGKFIQPAAEAFGEAEEFLGETALETATSLGASPEVAATVGAVAKTIPTFLLEVAGAASGKAVSKLKTGKELTDSIKAATPSVDDLKNASRAIFKEIDDIGATVQPKAFETLTKDIERAARSAGARPRTTPGAFGVIDEFKDVAESGRIINLDELDELRTVANNVAKTIDPAQKAPALAIIDEIDTFLDKSGTGILNIPQGAPNIGAEYRAARKVWGRARKGELLEEAFVKAKDTASGFENGLRIEFRKILKNRRQTKFFTEQERAVMRRVSEGTRTSNLAKLIGRLGFSEGQAINIVNPVIGGAAAGAAFGTPAGIAVPIIGQVSKQLAQKLTKNNGRFAQQVVQAGSNSAEITRAYLQNTPKAQRLASELAELFIRNEVDLTTTRSGLAKEAANIARQVKAGRRGALAGGAVAPSEET